MRSVHWHSPLEELLFANADGTKVISRLRRSAELGCRRV